MYLCIQSLGDVQIDHGFLSGLPGRSVVEDTESGLRWLLSDYPIQGWAWSRASSFGVAGAVVPVDDETFLYVLKEALPEQWGDSIHIDDSCWSVGSGDLPSLHEIVRPKVPADRPVSPFVHLHAHSEYSPLDGLATVNEMVKTAVDFGQPALAVTDHGVCAAHPELSKVASAAGIKPIFGIEANFVDNRKIKESVGDYFHLILWAQSDRGLRNLWGASTEAYREGFYGRARLDWDTLSRHNEGVMASTACLRGPLSDMILADDEDGVRATLARLQALFPDRLYVELHTNQLPQQKVVNRHLVDLARDFSLPVIAVADSHYACESHGHAHRVWIAAQTNKSLQDEGDLFAGDEQYHISSVDEVRSSLAYLPESVVEESIANTVSVADRCEAGIVGRTATPVYHRKGVEDGFVKDAEVLRQMCLDAWDEKVGPDKDQDLYRDRLEQELDLLVSKRFCGYILLVADYCRWCKDNSILMGPGRGSAAGSLVCYLTGITGVDPIDARLLFERFLTPGRTSLPDIDSDFPATKREDITRYIVNRWGEDRVVRVGTHIRLANRGVLRDIARVLKGSVDIDYRDVDAVSRIIEEAESGTAGLGLSWDELWAQAGDLLEPYRIKHPIWFQYAEMFVGRLKSYGKHAAGVVIDPEDSIVDRLPLRVADGQPTTEFAMEDLEFLGYVKFDLLTLRTLDTIQVCLDTIRDDPTFNGYFPDIYGWTPDQYTDPDVWDMLCEGDTLGVFQIETTTGTKLTKRFQPRSIDDLCAILTLVRPGPMRSGLTESYLARRSGSETVKPMHPKLESVLDKTYQTMIYQEDIMAVCRVLGGYSTEEADEVRSILGKKKLEKVEAEGRRFVARCVDNGVDEATALRLWDQMQEFARYAFNRSHSYAYAMLAYWTAWLKRHYPLHFLVAVMSTVKKERLPEFVGLAKRLGFDVLPPDINESHDGFSFGKDRTSIRYGFDSVKGIGEAAMHSIISGQPYTSMHDFLDRKGRSCHLGHVELLCHLGAFDSISGVTRASLESWVADLKSGRSDHCTMRDDSVSGPNGLPCTFDWSTEVRLGKSGKPLKPKPIPNRCGKTCRNYSARKIDTVPDVHPEISPAKIRNREMEILGVYLSSTPFDDVSDEVREQTVSAAQIEVSPAGDYITLGMVSKFRRMQDRSRKEMAFVDLVTQDGDLSLVCFSKEWEKYRRDIVRDRMMLVRVSKNNRGTRLLDVAPLIPGAT